MAKKPAAKKPAAKPKAKCDPVSCINKTMDRLLPISELLQPFALLGLRIWIGLIFWKSGIIKYSSWDTTLMLFEHEHPIPTFLFWGPPLDPAIAGFLGTTLEIAMPVLLILGLGARLATLPLILMTLVIQVTYTNSYEHYLWFVALLTILAFGAGRFSIDDFLRTKHRGDIEANSGIMLAISLVVVSIVSLVVAHEVLNLFLSPEGWDSWIDVWDNLWKKG